MTDAERIDELEATLADEEAGHQETLRLWLSAKSRIAELEQAMRQVLESADDELRRLGAVPGSNVAQIEADARAALEAKP